eukprot:gene8027-16446_t
MNNGAYVDQSRQKRKGGLDSFTNWAQSDAQKNGTQLSGGSNYGDSRGVHRAYKSDGNLPNHQYQPQSTMLELQQRIIKARETNLAFKKAVAQRIIVGLAQNDSRFTNQNESLSQPYQQTQQQSSPLQYSQGYPQIPLPSQSQQYNPQLQQPPQFLPHPSAQYPPQPYQSQFQPQFHGQYPQQMYQQPQPSSYSPSSSHPYEGGGGFQSQSHPYPYPSPSQYQSSSSPPPPLHPGVSMYPQQQFQQQQLQQQLYVTPTQQQQQQQQQLQPLSLQLDAIPETKSIQFPKQSDNNNNNNNNNTTNTTAASGELRNSSPSISTLINDSGLGSNLVNSNNSISNSSKLYGGKRYQDSALDEDRLNDILYSNPLQDSFISNSNNKNKNQYRDINKLTFDNISNEIEDDVERQIRKDKKKAAKSSQIQQKLQLQSESNKKPTPEKLNALKDEMSLLFQENLKILNEPIKIDVINKNTNIKLKYDSKRKDARTRIENLLAKTSKNDDEFRLPRWRHVAQGRLNPPPHTLIRPIEIFIAVGWMIVAFIAAPKVAISKRRNASKATDIEDRAATLNLYHEACCAWIGKIVRIPLASMQQDKTLDFNLSSPEFTKAKRTKKIEDLLQKKLMQIKVRARAIVQ